ncbi:branched-chain amino acid aminotransferase [Photobacterium aphoticum]|uniref:Branched-chain amino acid aminotransferase n=1 Tax=Photobacterium aphoticum TaxID=754436 RepID=A0A090QYU0_9GAMM|nr:branched-chain amino acid aminotransferase [Photobacterium aphoticum]
MISKGILYTPPTTSAILPGITRDTIMILAKERGYEVREENIAREACIWPMKSS